MFSGDPLVPSSCCFSFTLPGACPQLEKRLFHVSWTQVVRQDSFKIVVIKFIASYYGYLQCSEQRPDQFEYNNYHNKQRQEYKVCSFGCTLIQESLIKLAENPLYPAVISLFSIVRARYNRVSIALLVKILPTSSKDHGLITRT